MASPRFISAPHCGIYAGSAKNREADRIEIARVVESTGTFGRSVTGIRIRVVRLSVPQAVADPSSRRRRLVSDQHLQ